jgi:hypothetical protein
MRSHVAAFILASAMLCRLAAAQDVLTQMNNILARASLERTGTGAVDVGAFVPVSISFPGTQPVSTVSNEAVALDLVLQSVPVAGLPEFIGTITGTIPIQKFTFPEVVVVSSAFYSDNGTNELSSSRYRVLPASHPTQLSAILVPPVSELTSTLNETIHYRLRVTIKLRMGPDPACAAAGTTCTAEKTIEQRIPFQRLAIPTVFAGFEHDDFGGAALIVVPNNSPLGSAASTLSRLSTVLTGLSRLYDAVELVGGGWNPALPNLDILSDAISALPGGAVFRRANEIAQLESITVVEGRSLGRGDADDFFDSVLLIGVDAHIQLFSDTHFDTEDSYLVTTDHNPWFSITTPSSESHVAVLIDNLDSNLQSRPSGRVNEHGDNESFHDTLSSLRFR